MTIKAIETRYAGCRFRSRLEARWAVFFDHLGIKWEYEPQGVVVKRRITNWLDPNDGFAYLPDFWLPDDHLWCEVKGDLTDNDLDKVVDAAASLSEAGSPTVLLGPIPRPDNHHGYAPPLLFLHEGSLLARAWIPCAHCQGSPASRFEFQIADDSASIGSYDIRCEDVPGFLLRGFATHDQCKIISHGYQQARSARFEHGEVG